VHRFMAELRDARALGATLVAAVGPATADALRMEGVEPDLVPPEHWTPSLIDAFPDPDPDPEPGTDPGAGRRVLYPVADRAPNLMVEGLTQKGWVVERIEAYRTVALAPSDPALLDQMARADAVMFTSSSAIAAFTDLRDEQGQALPIPPIVVCIGPTTTASAEAAGLANVVTAHGASASGMVSALVHHLDQASPDGS
jgi:uroporphyrinogen-III synthase